MVKLFVTTLAFILLTSCSLNNFSGISKITSLESPPKQISSEKSDDGNSISNRGIIFAIKNEKQEPPPANSSNLKVEMILSEFDLEEQKVNELGIITANFFEQKFGLLGNEIIYISPSGELNSYHTQTKKTKIIPLPDIHPSKGFLGKNSVSDFILLENGTLYYLQGACSEGGYCALHKLTFESGEHQILKIFDEADRMFGFGTKFVDFVPNQNIVRFKRSTGYTISRKSEMHEINVKNNDVKLVATGSYILPCDLEGECDVAKYRTAEHEKYEMIFGKEERFTGAKSFAVNCGEYLLEAVPQITHNFEIDLKRDSQSIFKISEVEYVGCIE